MSVGSDIASAAVVAAELAVLEATAEATEAAAVANALSKEQEASVESTESLASVAQFVEDAAWAAARASECAAERAAAITAAAAAAAAAAAEATANSPLPTSTSGVEDSHNLSSHSTNIGPLRSEASLEWEAAARRLELIETEATLKLQGACFKYISYCYVSTLDHILDARGLKICILSTPCFLLPSSCSVRAAMARKTSAHCCSQCLRHP